MTANNPHTPADNADNPTTGEEYVWQKDPLWYKDAIIYQLHVKAFFDSNDDGTGDFRGLTQKLDYIQDLGVNAIWLLPFYPSPMRDDGYDIADYRNIFPAYGTRKDFRQFVREAHKRGLKVITELVVNHTSDQHPWFQAARQAPPGSAKRDFYVWNDDDKKFPETRIIFTDTETSNWAWDPVAKAYYWHRFFSHQPDLNYDNPKVVDAVIRNMRFWMDQGVDGMRLDAIPYLCVREGTNNENLPETHDAIKRIRAAVDEHYDNRMFLAEANQWPEDVREYFGDSDECHMAYHFPLMPRMYMAVAQEDRHPIVEIMDQTPDIPEDCQWAIFLRNHDELTLEMVTDRERDYMYETYAADKRMRINVGIRRRLAPLMGNDLDKIQLMNSLLMSMPGSPIIYYGDEIGMGDNFYLGDRNAVRTPMQWSPDRNGGFSKADPQALYLPPVMDPVYGYTSVNVEAQSRERSSLLNWMKRLIAVRKSSKAFSRGSLRFLRPGNRKILAYIREYEGESVLCVANLSRTAQPVELSLSEFKGRVPVEMMGHTSFPPIGDLPYLLTLPGYGLYWFKLHEEAEVPRWHEEMLPPAELSVLVLAAGWRSFFPDEVPAQRRKLAQSVCSEMETKLLPHFISLQRWYAAKDQHIERAPMLDKTTWKVGGHEWLLSFARTETEETATEDYFLPLAIEWSEDDDVLRPLLTAALAKIRQHNKVGILYDAFADRSFCNALVEGMATGQTVEFGAGHLAFTATAAYERSVDKSDLPYEVRRPSVAGSNTTVILGDKLFLKAYRHYQPGLHPELEIGRFLTEVSPFDHIIPVLGAVEYHRDDGGEPATVALLQQFVSNQGDAWTYTLDYLQRFLEQSLFNPEEAQELTPEEQHHNYLTLMQRLGQRTGELHSALAVSSGDRAFDPEPITAADTRRWAKSVRSDMQKAFKNLKRHDLSGETKDAAQRVLKLKKKIEARIDALAGEKPSAMKTRLHGDYHLGQVLVTENDFVIIDFEGEPARPIKERSLKHSALRDVAGILRSIDYATHAAIDDLTQDRPDDRTVMWPHAYRWRQLATDAFLAGYEQAVAGSGVYPEDPAAGRALIDFFTLEKALYEISYELGSRPAWVSIPLHGLLDLFESGS